MLGDRPLWFDKAGEPIDEREAFRLKYDFARESSEGVPISDYARIGQDTVGEADVSTVWLGLNHEFLPGRAPLIFETMIFGGAHDSWCARYSTEERARQGHAAVVAALAAREAPPVIGAGEEPESWREFMVRYDGFGVPPDETT